MDLKNVKFEKLSDDDKNEILSHISTIDVVSRYEFLIRLIDDNNLDSDIPFIEFLNNPEFDGMLSNLKIVYLAEGEYYKIDKNDFTSEIDYYASNIAYHTMIYDICKSDEDLKTSNELKEKFDIVVRRTKLQAISEISDAES
jgi:hypothetical protein